MAALRTNAEVYVHTPTAAFERTDLNRLIRVTGRLDGPGSTCGSGNRCWDLDYGFDETAIIRTADENAAPGHCITFVGPLSSFRGNFQLDTTNLDWLRVYQ